MTLAIVILAAGASSRMRGGDKMLETVNNRPLIAEMATRALAVTDQVWVTLPDLTHPRAIALSGLPLTLVPVPDAEDGMSASIRRGVSALTYGVNSALILPGDMPDITAQDIDKVSKFSRDHPEKVVRATSSAGTPGHPVVFPARLFDRLKDLRGDIGAKPVLKSEDVVFCALPQDHAITDLDTPEAWQNWRAAKTRSR